MLITGDLFNVRRSTLVLLFMGMVQSYIEMVLFILQLASNLLLLK